MSKLLFQLKKKIFLIVNSFCRKWPVVCGKRPCKKIFAIDLKENLGYDLRKFASKENMNVDLWTWNSEAPSDSELLPLKHSRKMQGLTLLVAEHTLTDPFVAETVTCHVTCHLLQITSLFCGSVSFPPFCIWTNCLKDFQDCILPCICTTSNFLSAM